MEKADAVAALGASSLLAPVRVQAALGANDRLKLGLTLLQAAQAHALAPDAAVADFAREVAAIRLASPAEAAWLQGLPGSAAWVDGGLVLPSLSRLLAWLADALATMARPLEDDATGEAVHLVQRAEAWRIRLGGLGEDGGHLGADALASLTHGQRDLGDSLHLLVMDLHKAINRLAARLATEVVDGAMSGRSPTTPTALA